MGVESRRPTTPERRPARLTVEDAAHVAREMLEQEERFFASQSDEAEARERREQMQALADGARDPARFGVRAIEILEALSRQTRDAGKRYACEFLARSIRERLS